jgi:hypothetical protein
VESKNHGNWSRKSNPKALKQAGLTFDIDLIELNEAFLLHKR